MTRTAIIKEGLFQEHGFDCGDRLFFVHMGEDAFYNRGQGEYFYADIFCGVSFDTRRMLLRFVPFGA